MNYLISFFLPLLLCFSFVQLLRPVYQNVGLVDRPSFRKTHQVEIPLIGGIGIYISCLVSLLFFYTGESSLVILFVSISFLVLIGTLDDYYDLSLFFRLISLFLAGFALAQNDVILSIPFIGIMMTSFYYSFAIASYSAVDGLDNLATSSGLMPIISIAVLSFVLEDYSVMTSALIISGALIGFLSLNYRAVMGGRRKVFLGEAGSILIGALLIWLMLEGKKSESLNFSYASFLWFSAYPLVNSLLVIFGRLRRGQSPFKADRKHMHHWLLMRGLSVNQTTLCLTLFSLLTSIIAILGVILKISDLILVCLFLILVGIVLVLFSDRNKPKPSKKIKRKLDTKRREVQLKPRYN